jgi:osmotically-inducible protein OsmY
VEWCALLIEGTMAVGQDRTIVQQVIQRLATRGLRSPCKIDVQARNGEVTLTGAIQYPHQRAAAKQAASTAAGVRSVIDRLSIKPPEKRR